MNFRISSSLFLAGTMIVTAGCGDGNVENQRSLRPVRQHVVGQSDGNTTRTFSGTAQARKIVNLSFRNDGVITQLEMRLGQRVRSGELLARLDNVSSRLAYEQAVFSLNSAASQMNTAKLTLDRTSSLYEVGNASLSDYENAKNSFRTAEASHESAQRSVEIQQDQLGYGFIYAPEAGTIAAIDAELNENISAGQTVAVLNAGSEMEVALGLPESVVNQVMQGMEVTVSFASLADTAFAGSVTEVSPSVDSTTATYPIRVSIADPEENIRTGMAAAVAFTLGTQNSPGGQIVVPSNAVGEDAQGRFVFLVQSGDGDVASVRKQYVTVGSLTSEGFIIHEGLAAGQAIATAGLQTLLDGDPVRVQ